MTEITNFEKFRDLYVGFAESCFRWSREFYEAAVFESTIKKLWITSEKLIENGRKYNLTSILDLEEIIRKHIIDSLLPFCIVFDNYLKERCGGIVDVGTGAGFPLMPLAAVFSKLAPETNLTGIEATGKKIRHIREAAASAGLEKVVAIQGRAEEIGKTAFRETQDVATARAVASLPVILELCIPLIKTGGLFVALKSHLHEELEQAEEVSETLGARAVKTIKYELPGGDSRTLIVYKKEKSTPDMFPRRYSEIIKGIKK